MQARNLFYSIAILFCILIETICSAQNSLVKKNEHLFIEPEIMLGKIVPNYQDYPKSDFKSSLFISVGKLHKSSEEKWASFYNYPTTGVSFSFSRLGNDKIFGYESCILPFITLKTSNNPTNSWYFKLGLGCSYISRIYNAQTNADNIAAGAHLNWSFQTFLYRNLWMSDRLWLKGGVGYLHASNGHTQLPNLGVNSAMLSISAMIFTHPDPICLTEDIKLKVDRNKHYFYQFRTGLGLQEFGSGIGPVGGPKKPVYTFAATTGIVYRQQIKVKTGFGYRFYPHYFDYIISKNDSDFIKNPKWNASNVFFSLGCEFLIGHFGMEIDGGINIHKPFFKRFHEVYESTGNTDFILKNIFLARLGFNYYLYNSSKNPNNNFYIGPTLNANFGQADFSEISFGYIHYIR